MNLMTKDDFPVEVSVRNGVSGDREEGEGDGETGVGGRGGERTDRLNGSQGQQSFASSRCRRSLGRVGERKGGRTRGGED